MRQHVLLLVFLAILCALSLPLALAQPVYWTVVADDGTAADVVNAANFAASMKASADVSFAGKTESQVADADQDPADLLTVHLQGDEAQIVYGTDPAFEQIADLAKRYLRDQGFTVTIREGVDTSAPVREPPRTMPVPLEDLPTDPTPVEEAAVVTQPVDDGAQALGIPAPGSDTVGATEPTADADQDAGPFVRLWRWIAALFS